jgi:signal transduction histidine kinase
VNGVDGSRHDIVFHKALFRDENGQAAGIIGVMHDITLQRDADRSRSEFVSMVAHELQTPLAAILGFSELLHEGSLGERERKEALEVIISKSEALSQMVTELLDLSRLESGRPLSVDKEQCDISNLLTGSIDSFRKRIATHRFVPDLPKSPVMVTVDCKRIGQVMENLLSNAVKYSGAASTIHVSAHTEGDICRITVRDEGVGMSPNQLEHLFDKFYRAKQKKTASGTGLGLFIVKSIVEAHHGKIHIASVLGQGTTVTVELPVEWKE